MTNLYDILGETGTRRVSKKVKEVAKELLDSGYSDVEIYAIASALAEAERTLLIKKGIILQHKN